jgi:hypothetical protein
MSPSKELLPYMRRSLLLALCVFASGCASESEMLKAARDRSNSAVEQLDRQPSCCQALSGLRYEKLSPNRTSGTFPSVPAQVRSFPAGRSYFMAVEVPQDRGPAVIDVRSGMLGGGRGSMATVFAPSVLALDGDFAPVATPKELGLCFRRGWSKKDVGYFSSLEVDASQVRYLVFFTDRSRLRDSVPYDSSATTAGLGFVVNTNVSYELPRSPDGQLDVWLDGATDSLGGLPERCRSR